MNHERTTCVRQPQSGKGWIAEDFSRHYRKTIPITERNKPGTLTELAFLEAEGTEVIMIRIFADAEAMDHKLKGAGERSRRTYEFIEPTAIEICGEPIAYSMRVPQIGRGIGSRDERLAWVPGRRNSRKT